MPDITISTISDHHQHGYRVLLWCKNCDNPSELDLKRMIERYGDKEMRVVLKALLCSECGRKGRPNVRSGRRVPKLEVLIIDID